MTMIKHSGWSDCHEAIASLLLDQASSFIGRLGGSDTDAIAAMIDGELEDAEAGRRAALSHLQTVKRYNGYYDHFDEQAKYFRYLNLLRHSYRSTSHLAMVDSKLLTLYFPDNLNPAHRLDTVRFEHGFQTLVAEISRSTGDWSAYPYTFFQTLMGQMNLFRVFEQTLSGLTVLVVSPFSKSTTANWPNRRRFIKDFEYPDFNLRLLNSPITYDGLPKEMYPHQDWFETLDCLKQEISTIDFDVALLSCRSYAMPLGQHVKEALNRKAIYVGGILQLFLGVTGRRYQNKFFTDFLNNDAYIYPLERDTYLSHVSITPESSKEAFGAYF